MSAGQRAMLELQKRFGGRVDPEQAFAAMDESLARMLGENTVLKNLLVAMAFDDGRLRQATQYVLDALAMKADAVPSALVVCALMDLERVEIGEQPAPRVTQAKPRIII